MKEAASLEGDEPLRLFCALRLPGDPLARLTAWQEEQLAGVDRVRVVRPEQLHITLAFLGARPTSELEGIVRELRRAAVAARPPQLVLRGYRETRSVGMLVFDDPDGTATALAEDLHVRLESRGVYRREVRPWLPHVTVVRFRERPRLEPVVPELDVVPSEAAVYHSVLRPTGAQYEILEAVSLGG